MRNLSIFIDGDKLDLFNDENISLTQTIQNVRDIAKVFTPFTQAFTVPASKANNKIFKHYYNYDIDNGFDARLRVDAKLELNYLPFKEGKIQLLGVEMRNNAPYAYKITFYGNTINLKDILGEDKLSSLSWLGGFRRTYDSSTVKADLQVNAKDLTNTIDGTLYTGAFCMPLIGCKTRLYYDSSTHGGTDVEYPSPLGGNLHYDGGSGSHHHGVYWEELKYGIRLYLIVKAIEESYSGIEFSADSFFKDTTNDQWYELYMWMHRNTGFAFDPSGTTYEELYDGFTDDLVQFSRAYMVQQSVRVFNLTGGQTIGFNLVTQRTSGTGDFTVTIKKDGIVYNQVVFPEATNPTSGTIVGALVNSSTGYEVYIEADGGSTFNVTWNLSDSGAGETGSFVGGSVTIAGNYTWNAQEQVPEIKVIDFLSGLFKMFNLTAFVQSDGKIKVQPLDDFYASGTDRDITKYVDTSKSSVDVALPYKEVTFEYAGRGTSVAKLYEERQGIGWGTEEYRIDNSLSGEIYKISLPFEHMQFEYLIDQGGTSIEKLQVGNFLDDRGEPYFGLPLLFYYERQQSATTSISFLNDISSTHSELFSWCSPLNSVSTNPATSTAVNHFRQEINEFTPTGNFNTTLFSEYYSDYISDVFNTKRRLKKVNANLPVSFLINYSLADTLIINGERYRINSIQTNLTTGDSTLELLNEL